LYIEEKIKVMPLIQFTNTNKYGTFRHRIVYRSGDKPFKIGRGFGNTVGIKAFKYTHEHIYPPALFTSSIDGQKYIMPSYQKVHPQTTLNDIEWIKPKSKNVEKTEIVQKPEEFKFESKSEPGSFYVVRVVNGKAKCNCAGQYRAKDRKCKHMKEVEKELGLDK
jgi:hypothetical protein